MVYEDEAGRLWWICERCDRGRRGRPEARVFEHVWVGSRLTSLHVPRFAGFDELAVRAWRFSDVAFAAAAPSGSVDPLGGR